MDESSGRATHAVAEQRRADLVAVGDRAVVALDFDGVLAPIVDDPDAAHIHPDAPDVLVGLAAHVAAVAIVTGRPARQAIALGGLDAMADRMADAGRELHLFGQYGNERWSSSRRRIISPRPPRGLASFERELSRVLHDADAADAHLEEKGLAVAIHTRRMGDPAGALQRLDRPVRELAERHGLAVEPGRHVLEVRAPGMDKGVAVRTLVEELSPAGCLFAGDDLGDLEAFAALSQLRESEGMANLLVCAASDEQPALAERADLVVPGPDGVLDLLRDLSREIASR